MALVDLIMPKLGESIMEATILKWHKKPGDTVKEDETVLDIATDKVDSEIPSSVQGIIEEIIYQENDIVPIGTVIATIRVKDGDNIVQKNSLPDIEKPINNEEKIDIEVPYYPPANNEIFKKSPENDTLRFYSPLVINIAQQEGVSMLELENIVGTGQDGRVSKKDILAYVKDKENKVGSEYSNTSISSFSQKEFIHQSNDENIPTPSISYDNKSNTEIIEMDRMRKLISNHMIESKNTSAHVTSFAECDVTNMVVWREKIKKDFETRIGEKITFTPLFIEAIVKSIKKYPLLSSSVVGDKIIVKKNLNKNYFLFSILIALLILTSIVRYSFVNNFKFQLNNYLKLKLKITEDFDFGVSIYFFLSYSFCVLYLVYLIFHEFIGEKNIFEETFYMKYLIFFLFFIVKNLLLQVLFYVFELKSVKMITNYIHLDKMILVSIFLLPLFTLESISNTRFK
jgi:pyruvate/2-oxoglutarate dehydrogenase complex dihydrolipoamide acyltransferase (E2) component